MVPRDADGRRVRAPRPQLDFTTNFRDNAEVLRFAGFLIGRIAHAASECMQDHLDDAEVVRDMHDIINDVGHLLAATSILERNLRLYPWTPPAGCPTCGGLWTRSRLPKTPLGGCADPWHVEHYPDSRLRKRDDTAGTPTEAV